MKKSYIKVGILTILSLSILIMGLLWLKGRAISAGERIEVAFQDVDGMRAGSAVQMMGIRIGQVEEIFPVIEPTRSFVKVRFVITTPDVKIPVASNISIQQSGLIGEKFLEITPPKLQIIYLPITEKTESLTLGSPVKMELSKKLHKIGEIKMLEVIETSSLSLSERTALGTDYAYKVGYVINMPGLIVPNRISYSILSKDKTNALKINTLDNLIVQCPSATSKYTIQEPTRLKDFMDLQFKAAQSLNETNDKINAILSEDVLSDVKITLANVRLLSQKANTTMDQAALLIENSRSDLDTVMDQTKKLTTNLNILTANLNEVAGDKEFKTSLIGTTKNLNTTTTHLNSLLGDKKTKDTLVYINETTKNLSEISAVLNDMSKDENLKSNFSEVVVNLNTSLEGLSKTLNAVGELSGEDKMVLKKLLNDTEETSANLKKFSAKLNKRFLLFRLMF